MRPSPCLVTTPAPPVSTPALPVTTPTLPVNGPAVPVVAHAWSLLGVTTDDPNTDTASQVDALASLPRRPALRVVLDQGTAPADYVDSVRKLAAVADVMALPLDSSDMKKLDAGQAGERARRYLEALQDAAPIWEVGNEVNGNWVGTDPVAKIEAMYDAAKAYGKQTAVTFYYENPATPGHDMLPWIDANIPAGHRLRSGLDYVLVSYYEDQNGGHQLTQAEIDQIFSGLAQRFPNARVGFGEFGWGGKIPTDAATRRQPDPALPRHHVLRACLRGRRLLLALPPDDEPEEQAGFRAAAAGRSPLRLLAKRRPGTSLSSSFRRASARSRASACEPRVQCPICRATSSRDTMLYAAIVATRSSCICVPKQACTCANSASGTSDVARHRIGEPDGHLHLRIAQGRSVGQRHFTRGLDLRIADTSGARMRHVRLEFGACAIEHGHPQDDQLAHIRRQAVAVAHGGQHLLPAIRKGWAVQEHLV